MRSSIIILILLTSRFVSAQVEFVCDTMFFDSRTGGVMDSMDVSLALSASTVDGNYFSIDNLSIPILVNDLSHPLYISKHVRNRMKFSALPRLGFNYSFGSRATQFFHANYIQAFNDQLLINLEYDRNSSGGYLRNSAFEKHDLKFALRGKWIHYDFKFRANYRLFKTNFSGGLVSDTLIDFFDPEFLAVLKANCNSRVSNAAISLEHRINFGDSIRRLGLRFDHEFEILNRKFYEEDTLYGIYTSYVDSFTTYDQFNLPVISNAAGFFYSKQRLYADVNYNLRYWEFQNSGLYTDTIENDINSNLKFIDQRIDLENNLSVNLTGNYGSFRNILAGKYKISPNSVIGLSAEFSSIAPDQYKRYYRSNNFNFYLTDIQNQKTNQFELMYRNKSLLDSLIDFSAKVNYTQLSGVYVWNDSVWSNTTMGDLSFLGASINLALRFKGLRFQNTLRYTNTNSLLIPEFVYKGRLFMQHPVFKSGKMKLQYGVGVTYVSSFQQRSLLPVVETFNWSDGAVTVLPGLANMNAFGGFQIDEFRFYFNVEEFGAFWNTLSREEVQGYPLARLRIRVGVVWDFFN